MASQTYTVKSGDTANKIAKSYGVGLSDISGYKSGNPDLIMPGENLTIGAPKDAGTSDVAGGTTGTKTSDATGYAAAVKSALGGDTTKTDTTGGTGTTDEYGKTLKDSIAGAQTKLQTATDSLANLKTNAYDTEYAKSGLSDKKDQIGSLDSSIAEKKAARDAAIAKVKANPGLSAALLTGTVSKLSDKANQEINNLIAERNTLAGDYNTGLNEVTTKVGAITGDAQTAYDAAYKSLENLTTQAKDYQSNLIDALKTNNTQDYQTKELAIQLMNAQTAAKNAGNKGNLTLARDSDGNPLYWFDSQGNIVPLSAGDSANVGGGSGYGSLGDTGAAGTGNGSANGAPSTAATDAVPWYQKLLGFFGLGK